MANYFALNQIFSELKMSLSADVIRIIGTNGKGSTGRFLAHMLAEFEHPKRANCSVSINIDEIFAKSGTNLEKYMHKFQKNSEKIYTLSAKNTIEYNNFKAKVAHFSSPHVYNVYERFYANYLSEFDIKTRCDKALSWLLESVAKTPNLQALELSFFEILCALIPVVFYDADVVIIEAGIGAKYDTTRIFNAKLNIITTIDIDHLEYFNDIVDIKRNKSYIKGAIVAYNENEKLQELAFFNDEIYTICREFIPTNFCAENSKILRQNFALANAGFFYLKNHFYYGRKISLNMPGRREKICEILCDAAHNEEAANALCSELCGEKYFALALNFKKQNQKIIAALCAKSKGFFALNLCAEIELKKFGIKNVKKFNKNLIINPTEWVFTGSFEAVKIAKKLYEND